MCLVVNAHLTRLTSRNGWLGCAIKIVFGRSKIENCNNNYIFVFIMCACHSSAILCLSTTIIGNIKLWKFNDIDAISANLIVLSVLPMTNCFRSDTVCASPHFCQQRSVAPNECKINNIDGHLTRDNDTFQLIILQGDAIVQSMRMELLLNTNCVEIDGMKIKC